MVPAVQMQNLARESKVLTAMNAVLALYCKHYWVLSICFYFPSCWRACYVRMRNRMCDRFHARYARL